MRKNSAVPYMIASYPGSSPAENVFLQERSLDTMLIYDEVNPVCLHKWIIGKKFFDFKLMTFFLCMFHV